MVVVTIAFGLWPRGYTFVNETRHTSDARAIEFGRYGLIYSRPFVPERFFQSNEFSLEMAFEPAPMNSGGFKSILMIHNGQDLEQFMVGQWKSWIIAMNGDDYNTRRRLPRISARVRPGDRVRFFTLVSGPKSTRVYIDGILKREIHGKPFLHIPKGKARLLIGNSVYGVNGWNGAIYGLAFYNRSLSRSEVREHYRQWHREDSLKFARHHDPVFLYLFSKDSFSRQVKDLGIAGKDLEDPRIMPVFKMKFFTLRTDFSTVGPVFFKDILINFLGFMPIGFASMLFIYGTGWFTFRKAALISLLFSFSLSLFIEFCQAWLPSRNSDILDLIFNTLGAVAGIGLYRLREILGAKRSQAQPAQKVDHRFMGRRS